MESEAQRQRLSLLDGATLVEDTLVALGAIPLMAAQRQRQPPLGGELLVVVVLLGPLFGGPGARDSNLLWRAQRGPKAHPEHRP